MVAVVAPILLAEKLDRLTIPALALGLGGMAVICFTQSTSAGKGLNAPGVVYALAAACCFSGLVMFIAAGPLVILY